MCWNLIRVRVVLELHVQIAKWWQCSTCIVLYLSSWSFEQNLFLEIAALQAVVNARTHTRVHTYTHKHTHTHHMQSRSHKKGERPALVLFRMAPSGCRKLTISPNLIAQAPVEFITPDISLTRVALRGKHCPTIAILCLYNQGSIPANKTMLAALRCCAWI